MQVDVPQAEHGGFLHPYPEVKEKRRGLFRWRCRFNSLSHIQIPKKKLGPEFSR